MQHYDVIKWNLFPRYWSFVRVTTGDRWPVDSPHKGQWRRDLIFSLICAWINAWVKNRDACDLRRHRAHHDVIVMNKGRTVCIFLRMCCRLLTCLPLRWRHNGHDGVSNHQPHDCLLNRLFGLTSKLSVTGFCVGNSPGTGEFPAQMASNAENVSIWWRHHTLPMSDENKWLFMKTSWHGHAFRITGPLCERHQPVTGGFPQKGPVTRSFDVFRTVSWNEVCYQWGCGIRDAIWGVFLTNNSIWRSIR